MKLLSTSLEKLAIRTILAGSKNTVANRLLGTLTPDHFHYPPALEAFNRLKHRLKSDGQIPTWIDLINDPSLEERNRRVWERYSKKPIKRESTGRTLINRLDEYRIIRSIYFRSRRNVDLLREDSVDIDTLVSENREVFNQERSIVDPDEVFRHFGTVNNGSGLIDRLKKGDVTPIIPTGITAYDQNNVGLALGSLFLIAATTGGGKCLKGDTLVPTSQGIKTLKELHKESVGPEVDGLRTLRNHYTQTTSGLKRIAKTYKTRGIGRKVKFKNGTIIEGLPEHKILALDSETYKLQFVRLDDLAGHWVPEFHGTNVFPQNIPQIAAPDLNKHTKKANTNYKRDGVMVPSEINENLAIVLGLLIAEGTVTKRDKWIRLTNHDPEVLEIFRNILFTEFNLITTENSHIQEVIPNIVVREWLYQQVGLKRAVSRFKEVPYIIRTSPEHIQSAFLKALFEGDGSIWGGNKIEYYTTSRVLAYQVKAMLNNMGIRTNMRWGKARAHNEREDQIMRKAYTIVIDKSFIEVFAEKVGFLCLRKQERLENALKHRDYIAHNAKQSSNLKSHGSNKLPLLSLYEKLRDRINQIIYPYTYVSGVNTYHYTIKRLWSLSNHRESNLAAKNGMITRNLLNKFEDMLEHAPSDILDIILSDKKCHKYRKQLAELSQYTWTKVEWTRRSKEIDVYDINIPGPHNYVASGLMSHNTAVVMNIAINMAKQGARVCHVNLEMSKDELECRLMANLAGIKHDKFLKPDERMGPEDYRKLEKAEKRFNRALKKINSQFTFMVPDVDPNIEELFMFLKPYEYDVIVVDMLNLLKGVSGDNQWRKLGDAARFAKRWASNNDCIVILLCQLSSEGLIRYAREMAEHASVVWTWIATEESRKSQVQKVKVVKARNGMTFDFKIRTDFARMRFVSQSIKDDEEEVDKKGKRAKKKKEEPMDDYYER